jgi:hypothetical protein
MTNPVLIYAGSMLLAFLVEAGIEYILGTPFDKVPKLQPFKWLLMYASLGAGMGLAYYYKLDLPALVMQVEPSWVGMVLTGSAIGRGANFINDLWQKYIVK